MAEYLILDTTLTAIADAIRSKTGGTDPIAVSAMPEQILGITSGGGSSADVCYVTFLSYDGTVEYGRKAVATGDDCADPIARGIFSSPTRETDAQYSYTFSGWSRASNGTADSTALTAVTEDRTLYASFTSAVRYYTVTFYDGETVLSTRSVAYGSTPSYTPAKEGYTFSGWEPALETVTGPASYYAQWIEMMDFNALSWSKIAEYAQAGTAAEVFELGATKTFYTSNSNRVAVTAEIIGFNHDELSDGSGKAGITLKMGVSFGNQFPNETSAWAGSGNTSNNRQASWDNCGPRTYWNSTSSNMPLTAVLPSDLVAVIKQVKKTYYDIPNAAMETTNDYLWVPSLTELGYAVGSGDFQEMGECYEAYTPGKTSAGTYSELIESSGGSAVMYMTRSKSGSSVTHPCISSSGKYTTKDQGSSLVHSFPHFCI